MKKKDVIKYLKKVLSTAKHIKVEEDLRVYVQISRNAAVSDFEVDGKFQKR